MERERRRERDRESNGEIGLVVFLKQNHGVNNMFDFLSFFFFDSSLSLKMFFNPILLNLDGLCVCYSLSLV